MSVVTSEIASDNPITAEDVRQAVSRMGFKINEDEVDDYRRLLAGAYETFEALNSMPDYHLPVDVERFPRTNVHQPLENNQFGVAWSYRFSVGGNSTKELNSSTSHRQLLAGKRLCVKDNVCVAGIPQFHGTDVVPAWVPHSDATVVTRILEAGGEIVGTATCENLSCTTVSNTSAAGTVHNPWAEGYSAGGSSSGVAALVGNPGNPVDSPWPSVDMGIGADQGGSIRVPAALCGLVGLKPTFGLVPYTGVASCEAVNDHVGPMCKTVWDTALLLEAIAGRDGVDDRQVGAHLHGEKRYSEDLEAWYSKTKESNGTKPLNGMRIAMLKEANNAGFLLPEMKKEILQAAEQLRELGAEVSEISVPAHALGAQLWMGASRHALTSSLLGKATGRRAYYHTPYLQSLLPWSQENWDKAPPAIKNVMINGSFQMEKYPALYAKCMNLALGVSREYQKFFETYDVFLLPATPSTARPLFDRDSVGPFTNIESTFGNTLNTMQFNLTGHPAMSVPTGLRADMSGKDSKVILPVAMQLVGPLFGEEKILRVGYAYEKAYDWKKDRP